MGKKNLSNGQISTLCLELSLLLHAGVGLGDGLSLMAEEAIDADSKMLLKSLADGIDTGETLPAVLRESGRFPAYVIGLLEVGDRAGRLEEALQALASHYEDRERLDRHIRSALLYPVVLLMLMLIVIVVLLGKVLPVFDQVYASLGGQMTGVAGGLLALGRQLDAIMPVLFALLALVAAVLALFAGSVNFRNKALSGWRKRDKGLSRQISDARLAQALAMGMRSGLPLEESISLAQELQSDVPSANARCDACLTRLRGGDDLAVSLKETDMLPAAACRLLALGIRGGSGDTAMEEVARRLTEDSETAIEEKVSRVEPALVLVTSLLVGIILLSVMLPLMNIMSTIG